MLLPALLLLTAWLPRIGDDARDLRATLAPPAESIGAARFDAQSRSVSNWRGEAASTLRPVSLAIVAGLSATDPAFVARCVKLNNYWCIKRARWPGEIGADSEGHTGFASADAGADAAASLLRRYYRDYGRRSALAIVRRWAPAECGTRNLAAGPVGTIVPSEVAPRGLGRTLRARYLARRLPGGGLRGRTVAPRGQALRVQPWSPLARMGHRLPPKNSLALKPVPNIAQRIAEPASIRVAARPSLAPSGANDPAALLDRRTPRPEAMVVESASLPPLAPGTSLLDLKAPAPFCANDEARIANYAGRIAAGVGLKPGDDLELFSTDGSPQPNLAAVMLVMSAVELGTMRAASDLVRAAVARLDTPGKATAAASSAEAPRE